MRCAALAVVVVASFGCAAAGVAKSQSSNTPAKILAGADVLRALVEGGGARQSSALRAASTAASDAATATAGASTHRHKTVTAHATAAAAPGPAATASGPAPAPGPAPAGHLLGWAADTHEEEFTNEYHPYTRRGLKEPHVRFDKRWANEMAEVGPGDYDLDKDYVHDDVLPSMKAGWEHPGRGEDIYRDGGHAGDPAAPCSAEEAERGCCTEGEPRGSRECKAPRGNRSGATCRIPVAFAGVLAALATISA